MAEIVPHQVPQVVGKDLPQPTYQFFLRVSPELSEISVRLQERLLHQVGSIHLPLQPSVEVQSSEQGQVIAIQLQELAERGGIASQGATHQLLNILSAA